MSWTERSVFESRLSFINEWRGKVEPVSALCARHGISRKTGYKWIGRYEQDGLSGLFDLSSARHTHAAAMSGAVVDAILALREERSTWGPRKLLARLCLDDPTTAWPAASTIGDLLRRAGKSRAPSSSGRD